MVGGLQGGMRGGGGASRGDEGWWVSGASRGDEGWWGGFKGG